MSIFRKTYSKGFAMLLAGAFVLSLSLTTSAATNYGPWSNLRTVTVTPTGLGAAVTSFPLLVRLTSADAAVFTASRSDGFDVRFCSVDRATDLSFQRVSFDKTAQTAEFWVLVPSVAGSGSTSFNMFWGNSAATDVSNSAAVFAPSNSYRAVWHMNAADNANDPDATGAGYDAIPVSTPTTVSTPVGTGKAFDGSAQYFKVKNSKGGALSFPAGGPFTMSWWMNPQTLQTCKQVLGKLYTGNCGVWTGSYGVSFNGSTAGFMRFNDINVDTRERAYYQLTADTWVHVVGVRYSTGTELSNVNIYINGVPSGSVDATTSGDTRTDSTNFTIAKDANLPDTTVDTANQYWMGQIDEIQVMAGAKDSNWVKLSYQTQGSPSVVVLGAVQQNGTAVLPSQNSSASALRFSARNSVVSWTLPQPAQVQVTFYNILGRTALTINELQQAGVHKMSLKNTNLPAGRYTVLFRANGLEKTGVVLITK